MTHFYGATSLTGGGTGALDSISGALLANNDVCLVDYSGVLVTYILDAASGLAESSPTIIAPDTAPGTKRWLLQSTAYSILTAGSDSFPVALAIPISTLVGRKSTGAIVALSKSDALTILNVADGATANAKATGAELDTGTDDAKFSTAKALKDSHNVPSVVPGTTGNVLTSNGTDWISQAVSGGGLGLANNLTFVVNASVNKLDIFTKSGGAVPDGTNFPTISIPDGTGYTQRTRKATYLSGTSQFIMADAANYWSKGSLDAEIKTAYIYAIWDAAGGIVWALGGYSGFTRCPASVTATDDDFFLLEASSTYTKVITDYCVCVGKIRYQYDTADTPDHTIQATVLDAPQVIWNPKSDYGKQFNLATSITVAGNISDDSRITLIVKQSGKYNIFGQVRGSGNSDVVIVYTRIKTGIATYGSATLKSFSDANSGAASFDVSVPGFVSGVCLNVGDSIHLGVQINGVSGNRTLLADDSQIGSTSLAFQRID